MGDGVSLTAGPLLLASITSDPALVAGAALAQQLPWLLFSLISGAFVDRVDRQRLFVVVNLLRGAVMGLLALSVVFDFVSIPLIYAVCFALGVGETLADTASAARLPSIVPRELLPQANARLSATYTVVNMFVAKPLGGWLFALAVAVPFGLNAATFVIAALLVAAMRPIPRPPVEEHRPLMQDIREGVRWLWRHRGLRTLCLVMATMQVGFCAAFAAFVLYAKERLGLSEVGFGFLLTAFAVGGLAGTAAAPWLERRFGAAVLLRAGMVVEGLTHLVLAVTTNVWVAAVTLVVFSVHAMLWGVVVGTVRQREVPDRLQGRVLSVYNLIDRAGVVAGTALGGLLAQRLGLVAPFWLAFAAMVVIVAVAWRRISDHW